MYHRNIVFLIHLPVLNHIESNNIIQIKNLNDHCSSHTCNEDDDTFDQQL